MAQKFFPNFEIKSSRLYAYSDSHPEYRGLLKIGYTTKIVEERVKQQYPTLTPGKPTYSIHLDEVAVRNDGSTFTDRDVHLYLKKKGFLNPDGEWKDFLESLKQ